MADAADPFAMVVDEPAEPGIWPRRSLKMPFELFLILIGAVVVLGVFVVLTGSERGDAEAGRADAEARVAVAESSAREMAAVNVDLIAQRSALEVRIDELTLQIESETAARVSAQAALSEIEEVDITGLEQEIVELTAEKAELDERLEEVAAELAVAPYGEDFAQYAGELLGGSSLAPEQSQCLGASVVEAVGFDRIGAGLKTDRTAEASDALVRAIDDAVSSCEIDPALLVR